jgi:hypothetical protein
MTAELRGRQKGKTGRLGHGTGVIGPREGLEQGEAFWMR